MTLSRIALYLSVRRSGVAKSSRRAPRTRASIFGLAKMSAQSASVHSRRTTYVACCPVSGLIATAFSPIR